MAAFAALPALSTVATVASVGIGAIGTVMQMQAAGAQAEAQAKQAQYQAEVARNNALIEEQNAQAATIAAAVEAQDQDRAALAELGALLSDQSASGLDLGSGSFMQIREGQETIAAVDRARLIQAGETEAQQHLQAAADFTTQSILSESQADNAREAGRVNQLGSLISGIGGVATTISGLDFGSAGGSSNSSAANTSRAPTTSIRPRARAV